MSWFGALKGPSANKPEQEDSPRTAKRKKLQEERLQRARQRDKVKKQIKAVQEAREAADLVEAELFALDPEIFAGEESSEITDEEAALLLEDTVDSQPTLEEAGTMEDFETENGTDGEKALDKLGSVRCEFNKNNIEFWFSELEGQLEIIEVKSQWIKAKALQRFLPIEIKEEVMSLLILTKANAGNDIYKRIKTELKSLFVQHLWEEFPKLLQELRHFF